MTGTVYISHAFKRDIKPLAKKYHSLRNSVDQLIKDLIANPFLGEDYGHGLYKIRLADKSKGTGKSGGFRIMYYHLIVTKDSADILLLSIFNKSEISTIKKADALKMLKAILTEHEEENQ